MEKTNSRITKLDGIRGILSVLVALNHSFLVLAIPSFANVWGQNYLLFSDWQSKIQQLLMLLGNGGAAVSMFFVLSGFVISLSMKNFVFNLPNYLLFLLKRLFRLYPLYLFTVTAISVAVWVGIDYQTFSGASTWYHWWMNFKLDFVEFLRNAFFVHINLGGVTWTLRVIVLATPILPLFYLLTKKLNWLTSFVFTCLLLYASFTVLDIPGFRDLRYLYMFFLGMTLPKYESVFAKLKPSTLYSMTPLLVLFFFAARYQTDEYIGGVFETIASFVLLGVILYKSEIKVLDFLDNKFFVYLGKISYSLYLVHFSILYLLARFMFQFLPQFDYSNNYLVVHLLLFVFSLAITVPASHLLNQFVETPPVNWLNKKLKRS